MSRLPYTLKTVRAKDEQPVEKTRVNIERYATYSHGHSAPSLLVLDIAIRGIVNPETVGAGFRVMENAVRFVMAHQRSAQGAV